MQKLYPVLGHSMRFALEPGDGALAEPCSPCALRPGELALLVKWEGGRPAGYVIHRVLLNLMGGRFVLTKGDANLLPDLPLSAFQPAGRVTSLERRGLRADAAPGPFWPLAAGYSFLANKFLLLAAYAAYFLFSAGAALLPRRFLAGLNAAYLFWESRLHPGACRLLSAPVRRLPAAGNGVTVKSGRITEDEVWSGKIVVADYLTIERGVSVRAEPGSEITFSRREPWFFPVVRAAHDGSLRELDSGLAKLLVYGEFSASGSPAAPVRFGGESFGGVHALGGGTVLLSDCVLEGAGASALSAWDHSFLRAERSAFISCRRGVELSGEAAASFRDCLFRGQAGPAVRVLDEASLNFYGGLADCSKGPAFEAAGRARAAICGAAAAGTDRALSISGEAKVLLGGFSAAGCRAGAILAEGGADLEARGCDLSSGAFGISAEGNAALRLVSCRISGNRGHAVSLSGRSSLTAAGCEFAGNGAGIAATGAGEVFLDSCSVSGSPGAAVSLIGHNRLRLLDCRLDGCSSGVEGAGRNRAEVKRSVFRGIGGPAVRLVRAASLSISDCVFDGALIGVLLDGCRGFGGSGLLFSDVTGTAVRAHDCHDFLLEGSVLRGGRSGAEFGGDSAARLRGCRFEGQAAAVAASGRSRTALESCSFIGPGVGVKAGEKSWICAVNCEFQDVPGPAAEAGGGSEVVLENCTVRGSGRALAASGRSSAVLRRVLAAAATFPCVTLEGSAGLLAVESSISSEVDALCVSDGASALLRTCSLFSSSAAAANLRGGTASLVRCSLRGERGMQVSAGAEVSCSDSSVAASGSGIDCAGALLARRLTLSGGQSGGMALGGPGSRLDGVRVTAAPSPGIAVAPGVRLRARDVAVDGRPWAPPVNAPSRPPLRRLLAGFAAATAGVFPFSMIYRGIYRLAVPAAALVLRGARLRALYLYRGMAQKAWVPGLSDMDLACVLDVSSAADDYAAYTSLSRRLRFLKALFPFTGEVMVADRVGFSSFIASWGTKAAEFPGSSRLLAGRAEPLSSRAPQAGPADWTEAFYAYTLLMRHFFSEDMPEKFLRRNCLKNLVDILRYTSPAGAPHRLSRRDYAARSGLELDDYMGRDREDYAWRAFGALHLAAPPFTGAEDGPASPEGGWFNRAAFNAAGEALSAKSGLRLSLVLDSLYRVYVLLPDEAAGDREAYLRTCGALRGSRASSPALTASPLLLSRRAFALLCRLPYLNNPLFWADLSSPLPGAGPEDGAVFCYGAVPRPRPSREELLVSAGSAAAHFLGSWRSLWGEMPPHYFYTRAAGLRLLLGTGESPSFSDPAALRSSLEDHGFPGPHWKEYLAGGSGRANYEHIASMAADIGRLTNAG